jgi:hypothetical protein
VTTPGKLRKLIVTLERADGSQTSAVIDWNGNTIHWNGTPELREAAKPECEAIWLALASDRFWHKEEKADALGT